MDFRLLKEIARKKWFQILILFGLFVVLVQPKVTIPTQNNQQKEMSTEHWFKDYSITSNDSIVAMNIQPNNVSSDIDEEVINKIAPIESVDISDKILEKNKQMIISECLRLEPDLSEWSKLNSVRKDIPTMNYILSVLEQEIGSNYLYADIQRGVKLVMKKIGR